MIDLEVYRRLDSQADQIQRMRESLEWKIAYVFYTLIGSLILGLLMFIFAKNS